MVFLYSQIELLCPMLMLDAASGLGAFFVSIDRP